MNSPFFSVIIPTYNRSYCIKRAVDSVLNQTFGDFELLIIDDFSTDNTEILLSQYTDVRLKYFRLDKNKGNAAARNKGIKEASGNYVTFLDSDDTYDLNFLKSLNNRINEDHENQFWWTGINLVKDGEVIGSRFWKPDFELPSSGFFKELKIGTNFGLTINRKVFERIGYFDENLRASVDRDLLLRLGLNFSGSGIDEKLVNYTLNSFDSVRSRMKNQADAYSLMIEKYYDIIQSSDNFKKYWYHKTMWLCYYSGNRDKARLYFKLLPKTLNSTALFLIFEFFPQNIATKIHKFFGSNGFQN